MFGSMHLSLLVAGRNIWFVMHIVLFTTSIGILAAWYREKTNSIIPAFLVHLISNILGSLPLLIMHFIK
jgi:membrane protease YdiL (CAAX protease family)